ncbi:unnamed protein product [Discula destructiva]
MAPSSLSIQTSQSPPATNGESPHGRVAVRNSPNNHGSKNSISSPSLATPTTSTTMTPPAPASAATVVSPKKLSSKLSRKDSIISVSGLKDKPEEDASPKVVAASPAPSPSVASPVNPGVDPLSQHIFTRTNTADTLFKQPRLRTSTTNAESVGPAVNPALRQSSDLGSRQQVEATDAAKDKKKGGSLLSRLGIRKPRGDLDSIHDDDSECSNEPRMDGADAQVFTTVVDATGYVPRHKEPPRYIRVRATNKKRQDREFNRMFLAQELIGTHPKLSPSGVQVNEQKQNAISSAAGSEVRRAGKTGGAIWTTEFSKDGRYLAAAGKDGIVRIWAVISTPEERQAEEQAEAAFSGERLSAPVFRERPVCEFSGHTNEIIDLSWSKNNFLLTTSMDKTVRLWYVNRDDCLCQFKHKDVVTKVAFHPTDDRFFLAGSLDMTLRLWSIPDKQVAWSAQLPDLITAVAFTPDGKTSIAGLLNGMCMVYETQGLKLQSQIHAKSSRGKNSKGSKITGIHTAAMSLNSGGNGTVPGDVKILISTNDSRIRLYNLRDGSLDTKLKGHENSCTQISATFSDDAQYIISGSESKKAFIWKAAPSTTVDSTKDKRPFESFDAHGEIVTTAVFAPKNTRQLLSASGDPLYDLCNPPPVVLMSADEAAASAASQAAVSESGSQELVDKPLLTAGLPKVECSPAYLARTAHPGGNIVVTTDDQGVIKVFRQDCAHAKRRFDNWETTSNISRRARGLKSAGLGRASSIRSSARSSTALSRRASLSTGLPAGKVSSEMIMNWRQNVEGGARPSSIVGIMSTPARSERSISPAKMARNSATNLAADARKLPYHASSLRSMPEKANGYRDMPDSPTSSVASRRRPETARRAPPAPLNLKDAERKKTDANPLPIPSLEVNGTDAEVKEQPRKEESPMSPPIPSFSFRPAEDDGPDLMRLDAAGGSYGFWNLNRWKGLASLKGSGAEAKKHQRNGSDAVSSGGYDNAADSAGHHRRKSLGSSVMASSSPTSAAISERPSHLRENSRLSTVSNTEDGSPYLRTNSVVSKLSSELTSDSEAAGDDGEAQAPCRKCGAKKPKTKKGLNPVLVCARCGSAYA